MSARLPPALRLLRPHQWSKNLLVFVGPVLGHQLGDPRLAGLAALCFAAFCLAASAGYVVNDLADLRDDRAHPQKRRRPLAAGELPVATAALLAAALLAAGLGCAALVSRPVLLCVGGYVLATLAYTFWVKRKLALDIVFLAGLYTTRIIAGALVTGLAPSFWLLAFSMFVFLSLASLKRSIEIATRDGETLAAYSARAYRDGDRATIAMLGIGSGLIAVLVLAFYINSREVTALYTHPDVLWLVCPLFLYWVVRIWLLAGRDQVHDDPIVFALKDRTSYVLLALVALIAAVAT